MERRKFAASLAALALMSCNPRLDQRKKRYDEKECPFCTPNPGVCGYCGGTAECTFCNGTGTRVTSTKNYPNRGIERLEYEEDCPYCKKTGKCRYCDGVGKCWACKGTGRIESWDFFDQYKEQKAKKKAIVKAEEKTDIARDKTEAKKDSSTTEKGKGQTENK